jgi:ATP-dependent Clp endopeptidase proteolytic subunit ClpP
MKKLYVIGVIGDEYGSEGCAALNVGIFLNNLKKDEEFEVYINSPGGSLFEGVAIYNLLAEYQNQMTIKIVGEASSAASVIACAGAEGKVHIAESALMLIHNPMLLAWTVDEDQAAKIASELRTVKNSVLTIYNNRTGIDNNELAELMKKDEYMNAERCVKLGFADKIYSPTKTEAKNLTEKMQNIMQHKYMFFKPTQTISTINNKTTISNKHTGGKAVDPKNLEDAISMLSKYEAKNQALTSQIAEANKSLEEFGVQLKARESEILALQEGIKLAKTEAEERNKTLAELRTKQFENEAKMFCERMFQETKLTRAEINGNAKEGELPDKVAFLMKARENSEELYQLMLKDIENRPSLVNLTDKSNFPAKEQENEFLAYAAKKYNNEVNNG